MSGAQFILMTLLVCLSTGASTAVATHLQLRPIRRAIDEIEGALEEMKLTLQALAARLGIVEQSVPKGANGVAKHSPTAAAKDDDQPYTHI